jgi:hypothetical protein
MGYVAYRSCLASEVPAGLTWGEPEYRFPVGPGLLVTEYGWPPDDDCARLGIFIVGAPWMRTTDTTLPEGDPRRVTWFRREPVTDLDAENSGRPDNH